MASIPFIGRLHLYEYLALTLSFILVILETVFRTITLLLPGPIIRFFYNLSRKLFNTLSSPYSRRARNKKKAVSSPIAQAQDFVELCNLYGYYAEEHIVQTGDGYLLGVHRLGWRKGEEDQRVNGGVGSVQKKVVYLHHGLLMNSEVWVCLTEKERCLPFTLVDQGYDVWLGNNRGNKYSKKNLHYAPTQTQFWNFSMDQFAFHDIPDSINYILSTTQQPSLSYIGFSQGSAQAFATLSIHPTLNNKVDVFVALAPAMAPPGLASGVVASLCKSNPEVLFLAFGRRAMLGSATMWQALFYPGIFAWFIDKCLLFLFGWKTMNITPHQKLAAYPHLYSFTSTKSVVHWFQIIRNGTFQMYDDEVSTPLAIGNGSKYYKVAKFPTRNIKTPIVLVYGGSDSLVDIKLMLAELPKHTIAKEIQKYEHLDLLWASDVDTLVFPHVLEALESYAAPSQTKHAALGWRTVNRGILDRAQLGTSESPNGSLPPGYSEDEFATHNTSSLRNNRQISGSVAAAFDFGLDDRPSTAEEHLDETDLEDEEEEEEGENTGAESFALTPASVPRHGAAGRVRPLSPSSETSTVINYRQASTTTPSRQKRARREEDAEAEASHRRTMGLSPARPTTTTTTTMMNSNDMGLTTPDRRILSPRRLRFPPEQSSDLQSAPRALLQQETTSPLSASTASPMSLSDRVRISGGRRDHSREEGQAEHHRHPHGTDVSKVAETPAARTKKRRNRDSLNGSDASATVIGAGFDQGSASGSGRRRPEGWWSSTSNSMESLRDVEDNGGDHRGG
ncbi:cholesterol esterase [Recurvomyces mirabilis]|uniref:Cholesterol esterase n=1 Tax=Recurvomyces mirabilis TaxID=574656 RepID=A0AAE0WRQ7_9PEZI|nr:cholesterol esterase [Recurvomyces mirabilis]KAK5157164.1 cholesterol esterase [Recurvomyces mirabilis]